MSAPELHQINSIEDYLAYEEFSELKNEYLDGELYAMAGGTIPHNRISRSVVSEIYGKLKGKSCEVFNSDQRLMPSQASGDFMYPDAMAVCGQIKTADIDPHSITNPVLIIEVLSDSTAAYDRGGKFHKYRQMESLQEYVLIEQGEPTIDVFRKNSEGIWQIVPRVEGLEGVLRLESLGIEVLLADVYADIEFEKLG